MNTPIYCSGSGKPVRDQISGTYIDCPTCGNPYLVTWMFTIRRHTTREIRAAHKVRPVRGGYPAADPTKSRFGKSEVTA